MVALAAAPPREAPAWGWDLRLPRYCGGKSLRRSRWILAFPSTRGITEWHTQSISLHYPFTSSPVMLLNAIHPSRLRKWERDSSQEAAEQALSRMPTGHAASPPAGPQHAPSAFPSCPLRPVSLSPNPPFTRPFSLRALCSTSKSALFYQAPP